MSSLIGPAVLALLLVAALGGIYFVGRRSGTTGQVAKDQGKTIDVLKDQQNAAAEAPRTPSELSARMKAGERF